MTAPPVVASLLALAFLCASAADSPDPAGASITGVVVDAEGNPLAGVEVHASKRGVPAVHTGEDGRFTVALDSGSVRYTRLTARHEDGGRMAFWEADDTTSSSLNANVEVRLVLKPSRAVEVRVVDGSGQPVSAARIAAQHAYDFVAFADSAADGRCSLRFPEDAKITSIAAMKPGVGFDYFENKASSKWLDVKPLPAEVTLTLDGASRFQVRAVDREGRPISGIEFCPWTLQKRDKNEYINVSGVTADFPLLRATDAQGLATFDYLPFSAKDGISILCRSAEWHQREDPTWPRSLIAGSDPPTMETVLLRNARAGGIVLREDGSPAAGVLLQAEGRGNTNHYCRKTARTRPDGTFEFTLSPEQSYIIAVTEQDWAAPSTTGFILREGEERSDLFFTLGKCTLVHGTLTHITSGDPLAHKTVTVVQKGADIPPGTFEKVGMFHEREERLVRWTQTDSQGRYAIRLGPGRYQVSADSAAEDRGELFVGDQPEIQRDFRVTPRE